MGFESAPARGIPTSVSDLVMTSRDNIEVEDVRTCLLSSRLAKFQQFGSESFFQIFFRLFRPSYKVHPEFLHLRAACSMVWFGLR